MSRFNECLAFVLDKEGGYTNDPVDRGGATNYGILQTEYSEYLKRHGLPNDSVREISKDHVEDIYYTEYWGPSRAETMPAPLDLIQFDASVNIGLYWAKRLLQRALYVAEDGILGPKTMAAIGKADIATLCQRVITYRRAYYQAIVKHDATQGKFLAGWLNRCSALELAATK